MTTMETIKYFKKDDYIETVMAFSFAFLLLLLLDGWVDGLQGWSPAAAAAGTWIAGFSEHSLVEGFLYSL